MDLGHSSDTKQSSFPPSEQSRILAMAGRYARSCENICWRVLRVLPLVFVHGVTTWGFLSVASISLNPGRDRFIGPWSAAVELGLWFMANWCYVTAVFTSPGTTISRHGQPSLPIQNPASATSLTVKSNGGMRFCKKCQARKPDRAHHCSTCRRCVLKMDHHCPWLATCVGLRNYKPFILFLVYTTLLCAFTCAVSVSWVWLDLVPMGDPSRSSLESVNQMVLAIFSLMVGLVIGGFTGWHMMLAIRGQTTIECLEKTRYLSPLRKSLYDGHTAGRGVARPSFGQQLIDIHANALPGITRPEEGEERRSPTVTAPPPPPPPPPPSSSSSSSSLSLSSPSPPSSFASYEEMERYRSRKQYESYRDEMESEGLPNAFDLGWRANLLHLFGRNPWLWLLPVCTTTGDGWAWLANPRWVEAHEQLRRAREEQHAREMRAGWLADGSAVYPQRPGAPGAPGVPATFGRPSPRPMPRSKADRVLGRDPNPYADAVSMRRLSPLGRAAAAPQGEGGSYDLDNEHDGLNEDAGAIRSPGPLKPLGSPGWGGPRGGASSILTRTAALARKNTGTTEERQSLMSSGIEDTDVD